MSDPVNENDLRRILRESAVPEHNKFVERQSLDKAMMKFDQKNALSRQGTGWWRRLMGTARMVLHPNDGAFMKKTYMAAGGLCAATLAIRRFASCCATQRASNEAVR